MIRLSYPKAAGSYGNIEVVAIQINGDQILAVQEKGGRGLSFSLFAQFNGAWFKPSRNWQNLDAAETMDEISLTPSQARSSIGVVVEGDMVVTSTSDPDEDNVIGSGERLALLSSTSGIELVNEKGLLARWQDIPGAWFGADGRELGRRLLLVSPAIDGLDRSAEVRFTPGTRRRPSLLAERSA